MVHKRFLPIAIIAGVLFITVGCASKQTNTTNSVDSTSTVESTAKVNPYPDYNAKFVGTINDSDAFEATIPMSSGPMIGYYTFKKDNQKHESITYIDEENTNLLSIKDNGETQPKNPGAFTVTLARPGSYSGTYVADGSNTSLPVVLEQVDNDSAEQKDFGGHFVRGNSAYVDILFLDQTHVKFQMLAGYPDFLTQGFNNWEVANVATVEKANDSYSFKTGEGACEITIKWNTGGLSATSKPGCESAGANTDFTGTYTRTSTTIPTWNIFNDIQG